MKRFTIMIIVFVALSLVLTACGGPKSGDSATERGIFSGAKKDIGTTFIGGVAELNMEFERDRPPKDVFDDGSTFDVEVQIINNGEHTILRDSISLRLHGVNPAQFGSSAAEFVKSPNLDLIPRRKDAEGNIINAEPEYVIFGPLSYNQPVAGNIPFPLRLEACYDYSTRAVSTMCVRDDIIRPVDDAVCVINSDRDFANSAAPVQITNVKESAVSANAVAIFFEVTKSGSGRLFKVGSDCDATDTQNLDKVLVKIDTGMPGLQCDGLRDGSSTGTGYEGYADLRRGSDNVRCVQTLSSQTDFIQIVNIELEYAYQQSISTQITVKPSNLG